MAQIAGGVLCDSAPDSSAFATTFFEKLTLTIRRDDVLHFLGYPHGRQPAQGVTTMLGEVIVEARRLVTARGAYCELPVAQASAVGLEPERAERLVIGLVTAGAGIEERVALCLRAGDVTRGLLFDATGSAAAEEAANRLSALIVGESPRAPREVSCRVSPGYGGWPLAAQPALFAHLPHARLGISLSPSLMMIPRKSVSFAMWIGADTSPKMGRSGCSACHLNHCVYRRQRVKTPVSKPAKGRT